MKQTMVEIALKELGVKEATGQNDGIPAKRYMRGDKLAWCAGFVLYCNETSCYEDLSPTDKDYYRLRSVKAMEARAIELGKFHKYTDKFIPQANDIIIFGSRMGSDSAKGGHHVGIVVSVDGPSKMVHTIEGNTGNAVRLRKYSLINDSIRGYIRLNVIP